MPLAGRLVNGCSVSKSPPFGCQRTNVPEIPMRLKGKAGSHYTSRRNRSEVKSSDLNSWPGTRSTRAGTTSFHNLLPYPAKLVSVVKTHGNATEFQSSAILDCPPRRIVVDFRCLASHGSRMFPPDGVYTIGRLRRRRSFFTRVDGYNPSICDPKGPRCA